MEDLYGTDAYNRAFGLVPLKYAKGNANGQVAKPNTIGSLAGRTELAPTLAAFNAGINPNEVYAKAGLQTAKGSYTGINGSWVPATGASDTDEARNARIAALIAAGMKDSAARAEADNGFHMAETDADRESRLAAEYQRATGRTYELRNQQPQLNHPAFAPLAAPVPKVNGYKATQAGSAGNGWRAGVNVPATVTPTGTATATAATTAVPVTTPPKIETTGFRLPTNQRAYGSGFARGATSAKSNYRRGIQYDR